MTTPRTERFGLVLSVAEREGLRYLAEMEGLAEADVLRRLLRLAINDLPLESKQAINWPIMGTVPASHQDPSRATRGPREYSYRRS